MSSHIANYTNLHESVNANLYLTLGYADLHTYGMDCIDWVNEKIDKKEVTQESLCAAMGKAGTPMSQATLSRILDRTTKDPSYRRINAIIRACGGDPDAWMGEDANLVERRISGPSLHSASLEQLAAELYARTNAPPKQASNER